MILGITGVTGSLGQAILKNQEFLKQNRITKIIGLSRDEQKQTKLQREYSGSIPLRLFLADVTDRERMAFALKNANYVIHAAAQKHIDKFETDVPTGYKTNILGTQYVASGFMNSVIATSGVMLSTDKAVLPTTTYGVSKLAAEKLWLWNNSYQKNVKFGCVTYGNVFGSRGSVIELWTEKAKKGLPLPITSIFCTRYFLMIDEAADFVLRSLFNNERKTHVPVMKAAYMKDVAEIIWKHWNLDMPMQLLEVGMRGSEKLHEILEVNGLSSFEADKFTLKELDLMYKAWLRSFEI